MTTNYYRVLRCRPDASYEEIKRQYRDLVLKCHPDKGNSRGNAKYSFHEIDEAWKVLRDPFKRRAYDECMRQSKLEDRSLIYGTFRLNELNYDPSTKTYSYICRCGGFYNVSREVGEDFHSCIVGCEQCSLMILVNFK